jgi:5-methylcytosine-specific restriction endonuclease McrA
MKHCFNCNQTKELTEFYTNKRKASGYHCYCKVCSKEKNKQWKTNNKEKAAVYDKAWQEKNKDKKSKNYKNWQVNNRAKVNSYNSYRRALEVQATPKWLTASHKLHMECKYSLAVMFSKYTAEQHHVDHIVPLNGKTVCGLHVPWNLKVIPATENLRKSNKI